MSVDPTPTPVTKPGELADPTVATVVFVLLQLAGK
jgi:hypothetical protein